MTRPTQNIGSVIFLIFSCCSPHTIDIENSVPSLELAKEFKATKTELISVKREPGLIAFKIEGGGHSLSATVDKSGLVTILDYPSEWRGNLSLLRGDDNNIPSAFSLMECEKIRKEAQSYFLPEIIRFHYRSRIRFEVPLFLSYGFLGIIRETLEKMGHHFPLLILKNPADTIFCESSLKLSDNAITKILGEPWMLEEELNLCRRGLLPSLYERDLIINSGDVLCDLIHGDAELVMTHKIKGEDRAIKIVYGPMEVKIK
jgi:hypothetical protein